MALKFFFFFSFFFFFFWGNSPIVPPNSMTQTSAGPSFPSTGTIATRSIHSWMASVMWGTTFYTKKKKQNEHIKMLMHHYWIKIRIITYLDSFSKIISFSLFVNNRLLHNKDNNSRNEKVEAIEIIYVALECNDLFEEQRKLSLRES